MTLDQLRALLDFWPASTEVSAQGTAGGVLVVLITPGKRPEPETLKKMLELLEGK